MSVGNRKETEVVTMQENKRNQTETERELELSDLPVGSYWLRGIKSWKNLADIGAKNIKALIALCRRTERYRREAIKENRYFSEFGQENDKERLIIVRRCIKSLQGFLKEMPESDLKKPYLSHLRRDDLFQIGDRVVVLLPYPQEGMYIQKINRKLKDKDWVMATIVAPEMEAQFCNWSLKDSKESVICLTDISFYGGVAGGVDPRYLIMERKNYEIIPEEEFRFLREGDQDFLEIWINNISPKKLVKGLRERIRSGEVVKGRQKKPLTYKETLIQKLAKEFKATSGNSGDQKAILIQMEEIAEEFDELRVLVDAVGENSEEGLAALKKMLDINLDFHELHWMHVSWLEMYSDLQKIVIQRMLEKADEASEYCIVCSIASDLEDIAWKEILQIHNDSSFEEWRSQVSFSVRKNSPELKRLALCEMAKRAETLDDWMILYHDATYNKSHPELAKISEFAWKEITEMIGTCDDWINKVCFDPYIMGSKHLFKRPLAEAKKVCLTKEDKERISRFEEYIKK